MKTCPDCGERVYDLGCTWCNEEAYIEEQAQFTALETWESGKSDPAVVAVDRVTSERPRATDSVPVDAALKESR